MVDLYIFAIGHHVMEAKKVNPPIHQIKTTTKLNRVTLYGKQFKYTGLKRADTTAQNIYFMVAIACRAVFIGLY